MWPFAQVALVKHGLEEDGLTALAKIFTGPKAKSRWKPRWGLGRSGGSGDSRSGSFSEPQMHETLQPSPSFKERRTLRRWASSNKAPPSSQLLVKGPAYRPLQSGLSTAAVLWC